METPRSGTRKNKRSPNISSFTRAAGCLSQAAATLSTAAQAMAMAAEAFSTAGLEMEVFFCGPSLSSVKHMFSTPLGGQEQSPSLQELDGYSSSVKSDHHESRSGYAESDEDIDFYMSDEDEDYVYALLRRQLEENIRRESISNVSSRGPITPTRDNTPNESIPEEHPSNRSHFEQLLPTAVPEISTPESIHSVNQTSHPAGNPPQTTTSSIQRRMIVDREADILPVVCAVSLDFDKVVVYVSCALSSMSFYQKIIKAVTETSVYSVSNPTQSDIDRARRAFDKQKSAIILFPDTVRSGIVFESTESLCVIHLGWPHSTETYQAQIKMHAASQTVLVASAHEQGIYPSCSDVLSLTLPWPEDSCLLIAKVAETLRPKLQSALSEIPNSLKEAYYLAWIELHGSKGSRYVDSWTPTSLVSHANLHFSSVLQYRAQNLEHPEVAEHLKISIPGVSAEFVKLNELESAVDSGVLNMISKFSAPGSAPNNTTTTVTSNTQLPPNRPNSQIPVDSTTTEPTTRPGTESSPLNPRPFGVSSDQKTSALVSSIALRSSCEILTLQDEFDVIPVVCELARSYGKVVCYLAYSLPIVTIYKELIQDATGLEVILGVLESAGAEFQGKSKGVLLLPENFRAEVKLESSLVKCLIHVGWPSNTSRYLAQAAQYEFPVSILVAYAQDASLFPSDTDIISQMLPYAHENMLETPGVQMMRTSVDAFLAKMPIRKVQALYENWLSDHGHHGHRHVQSWTPLILALRANQYLLDVLKYQVHLKAKFALPASLPALWPSYIKFHGLQSAVDAGILHVIAPATVVPNISPINATPAQNRTNSSNPLSSLSMHTHNGPASEASKAEKSSKGDTNISKEYLIVQDVFDIIPAVCHLAADKRHKNTICYANFVGIMQTLAVQVQKMTARPVFVIATENSAAIPKVLQAFDSNTGGLVFCNSFIPTISKIYAKKIDQVIHVGWDGDTVRYKAQVNHSGLIQTRMILTTPQHAIVSQPVDQLKSVGLQLGPITGSSLALSRDQWRQQLKEAPKRSLNGCYMEWMAYHGAGTYKVHSWSKVDLVANANTFASSVLLRGTGSASNSRLLGGPLAVTPGFLKRQSLQPAVDAKILRVED